MRILTWLAVALVGVVLTGSAAFAQETIDACIRLTIAGSPTEDIDAVVTVDPTRRLSGIGAVPLSGLGANRTRFNRPVNLFGHCNNTECRLGAKETPVPEEPSVREWGGVISIATGGGPAHVFELVPAAAVTGNAITAGQRPASLLIRLGFCSPPAAALSAPD